MKICYFCDFENFNLGDVCVRCGQPISGIRHEIFNIPGFIKQNYQLYAIFGILVALYEYLVRAEVPAEQKYIGLFPLLFAFYLIFHLTNKAYKTSTSRHWQSTEELIHRESFFQFIIFAGTHALLILSLLMNTPIETRNYMGYSMGMFIFLIIFSANYSYEQNRKLFWILVLSVLSSEAFIFLRIISPFVAKIADSTNFVSCYTFIVQVPIYLALSGFLTYLLITVGPNIIREQYIPPLLILQRERERGKYILEIVLGLDILFGIILGPFIFFGLAP